MPDDDRQAELYELTHELLGAAGLPAYEISNHARPGEESRHNLIYWRSGAWAGIGPGAHGRLDPAGGRLATEAWRLPKARLERVEGAGSGERTRAALSVPEQVEELLVMGLRLAEGVDLAGLESIAGLPCDQVLEPAALERFVADGWLALNEGRLAATAAGRQRLNGILAALLEGTPDQTRAAAPAR
jgi:oxygen-independent coproporphyrinogen-3 oxidase